MLELSEAQKEKVRAEWGSGNPERIANVALGLTFEFGDDIGLDHDDQVSHALHTGILVQRNLSSLPLPAGVELFLDQFESVVLNGEPL